MRTSCSCGSMWRSDARLLHRLRDDLVDRPDDRRVFGVEVVVGLFLFFRRGLFDEALGVRVEDALAIECVGDRAGLGEHDTNGASRDRPDVVDRDDVRRVGDGDDERFAVEREREDAVPLRQLHRDRRDGLRFELPVVEIDEVVTETAWGPDVRVELDEGGFDRAAGTRGMREHVARFDVRDEPTLDQRLERRQGLPAACHQSSTFPRLTNASL